MRIPKRNPKHDKAFINRPDLTQILQFSPISPYAPQSTNSDAPGPSATQMAPSKPPTPILKKSSKRQLTISDTSDSDTSSVRKNKRTLKKKTSQTIVEKVRNTVGYSENERQDIGEISTKSSSEWTEDPQNLPRDMTVLQAENEENSDTELTSSNFINSYILLII